MFGGFLLAIGIVVLIALDIPAKAERAAGTAVGDAGFTVSGYQIVGLNHMDRALVDGVVNDELHRAAEDAGRAKAPQALVDVAAIRARLLQFGWVKDARVSRRLPDTLVIDIVERHAARAVAEQGPAGLDRRRRRGARPRAGRQDARPAAADRPGRQSPGAGARSG